MTEQITRALSGSVRAYLPYAWESLPELVNLSAGDEWWMDPVACRRLSLDLIGSAAADGIVADVVHATLWNSVTAVDKVEEIAEDIGSEPAIGQAIESFRKFVTAMPAPVLGVLPDIQRLLPRVDEDLLGDALCDLARDAMATGVAGLVILGDSPQSSIAARVVRLADNFGCAVVSLGPAEIRDAERGCVEAWQVSQLDTPGNVSLNGKAATGLILTPGDVSGVWTRAEIAAFGAR